MSRALSQRASQKPSRPASKATVIRLIMCPEVKTYSRKRDVPSLPFCFCIGASESPPPKGVRRDCIPR